jgi:sigma-54 dependent transcriptional regulator, acetoin dehydrogenase operon transcriptional activator AcoR
MHDLAHRDGGGVPRRLLASWQRSEDYGVALEDVEPVFTGTDDLGSLFFQCGNEVLADLHSTLAGEPVSLMLTDAEGVVLSRLSGDRGLLQALDDVHLAPGFAYAERDVGTNGLGLALADRVPTLVRADQHYALSLCTFTRVGPAGGQRQPHHLVAVVQRAASRVGAVRGQ